jgi:hypothetical protein
MTESDRMLATPPAREGADAARATRIQGERERARVPMLRDVLKRLRNDFLDKRLREIDRDIHLPELDKTSLDALLQERHELNQQKKEPLV